MAQWLARLLVVCLCLFGSRWDAAGAGERTSPLPGAPAHADAVCLPRPRASPLDAVLYGLCHAYRDGRLSAQSYQAALLDYPVLVAAVTALAGFNEEAGRDARVGIEATLRRNRALRQACAMPPGGSTGLTRYCRLLREP